MTTNEQVPTELADPKACPRCGQPHGRCIGHNRRGGPCGVRALVGQRVCHLHGGKSPQALAKAEERIAEQEANAAVADIWGGLAGASPVSDPVDLLARTAGVLEQMADVIGGRVNDLKGKLATGEHLGQLRAEVVLLDRVIDKTIKASEALARLGLAERQIELQAGQAELVVGAARAMLDELELLPADRSRAILVFLTRLGRGPVAGSVSGPTVLGEVAASEPEGGP